MGLTNIAPDAEDLDRWRREDAEARAYYAKAKANLAASDLQASQAVGSGLGRKYDAGKAPVAQGFVAYFAKAMEAIARISEYGSKKYNAPYSDQNWRKVEGAEGRYADALMRHLTAHLRGEELDPESGKPHLDHAGWGICALIELREQNKKATT